MEQNTAHGVAVAVEYCDTCGREPICGGCAWAIWVQVGVRHHDVLWGNLTRAAAHAIARTARDAEARRREECCQCRGELNQEHHDPEQPLPIIPGRPVGWTTCPHCCMTLSTLESGARIPHHSCTSSGSSRTIAQSDRIVLEAGAR